MLTAGSSVFLLQCLYWLGVLSYTINFTQTQPDPLLSYYHSLGFCWPEVDEIHPCLHENLMFPLLATSPTGIECLPLCSIFDESIHLVREISDVAHDYRCDDWSVPPSPVVSSNSHLAATSFHPQLVADMVSPRVQYSRTL